VVPPEGAGVSSPSLVSVVGEPVSPVIPEGTGVEPGSPTGEATGLALGGAVLPVEGAGVSSTRPAVGVPATGVAAGASGFQLSGTLPEPSGPSSELALGGEVVPPEGAGVSFPKSVP